MNPALVPIIIANVFSINKIWVGYLHTEKSFDTIFNIGCGGGGTTTTTTPSIENTVFIIAHRLIVKIFLCINSNAIDRHLFKFRLK